MASGPGRCHTGGLRISFVRSEGAAGTIYDDFAIVNTGQRPCTLYGFVGMLMLDSAGRPLTTHVIRNGGPGSRFSPSLVLLQGGQGAGFEAIWSDVPRGSAADCRDAARLEITPPDEFDHVVIPVTGWYLGPCAGGQINVTAVALPGI
jgi:hypothetical protein